MTTYPDALPDDWMAWPNNIYSCEDAARILGPQEHTP